VKEGRERRRIKESSWQGELVNHERKNKLPDHRSGTEHRSSVPGTLKDEERVLVGGGGIVAGCTYREYARLERFLMFLLSRMDALPTPTRKPSIFNKLYSKCHICMILQICLPVQNVGSLVLHLDGSFYYYRRFPGVLS
jgi:hypothetical protein